MVLLTINHQSLVATKANRMVRAAGDRLIMEFGSRRAQGYDAAILGARATYIGGCGATACAITDRDFGVPAVGTMAHSWVQMFDSEYEAFRSYAQIYPDDCTLLVDTYNVLKSGIPNAIKVFNEVILPQGYRPKGVRIDSGDIAYLSKRARKMLDEAGFSDVKIVASNSLDEYIIRDLILQGAKIDSFGIGERLITSKSDPVFGGVYKLVAVEKDGEYVPKIKISESPEKIINPHFKKLYRLFDQTGPCGCRLCLRPRRAAGHREPDHPDHLRPAGHLETLHAGKCARQGDAQTHLPKRGAGLRAAQHPRRPPPLQGAGGHPCGTRSSALRTRTTTTSTCRRSCGTSKTTCWPGCRFTRNNSSKKDDSKTESSFCLEQ